jgi:hypothetical protein
MENTENNKPGMTVDALYDYITQQLSPEEALRRLLTSSLISYEKLKFDKEAGEAVHPLFIISMAAMDMGWQIAIPNLDPEAEVTGIACGTAEYIQSLFKRDTVSDDKPGPGPGYENLEDWQ